MVFEIMTKKWGNSIGIVIPAEVSIRLNIKPEEEILVDIEKKNNVLKELFGKGKSNKSASEMIKKFRQEFNSKWLK